MLFGSRRVAKRAGCPQTEDSTRYGLAVHDTAARTGANGWARVPVARAFLGARVLLAMNVGRTTEAELRGHRQRSRTRSVIREKRRKTRKTRKERHLKEDEIRKEGPCELRVGEGK